MAYTDGVSEACNDAGDEFGETRLSELISTHRRLSASAICATVLDTVRAHRGSRQDQDDVTVMVVKALQGPGA